MKPYPPIQGIASINSTRIAHAVRLRRMTRKDLKRALKFIGKKYYGKLNQSGSTLEECMTIAGMIMKEGGIMR